MKKAYETPQVQVIGAVSELTLAATVGTVLDGDFAAGTPLTEVGLS